MLCEAANCTGELQPVKLKPVPLTATLETVTFAFPVFVNVTFCETVLPAVTVPKLTLEGPTEIVGGGALATAARRRRNRWHCWTPSASRCNSRKLSGRTARPR